MSEQKIEKGDFIKADTGLPVGLVKSEGFISKIPAYLINIGGGKTSVVLKDQAVLICKKHD